MMKYYSTVLLILLPLFLLCQNDPSGQNVDPPPGGNQDNNGGGGPDTLRNIYWVHGLGGTANTSWTRVGDHVELTLYKALSHYPGYGQTTLGVAGSTLLTEMNGYQVNPDAAPPIAIGHSQGGLAIRAAERRAMEQGGQPVPFGGIATFGTPHGGAPIISNVPEILNFLEEGCNVIATTFISELVETNFLLDLFFDGDSLAAKLTMPFCDFIAQGITPAALSGFLAGTTNDYMPESEYLDSLNNFPHALHNVVFYGEEEDPVFYRTMAWLATSPESVGVYAANEDDDFIGSIDSTRMRMLDRANHYRKLSEDFGYWLKHFWLTAAGGALGAYAAFEAHQNENKGQKENFMRAAHWIANIDNMWKQLIGVATDAATVRKAYCECREYNGGSLEDVTVTQVPLGYDCGSLEDSYTICSYFEEIDFEFMEFDESDGIVPATSAKAFPGAAIGDAMLRSNHQQMRNDVNTQTALEGQLFSGQLNPFFFVEPR